MVHISQFIAVAVAVRLCAQLGKSLEAELKMAKINNVGVHNLSPGMVTTELLMSGANTPTAKFFINCLGGCWRASSLIGNLFLTCLCSCKGCGHKSVTVGAMKSNTCSQQPLPLAYCFHACKAAIMHVRQLSCM